MCTHFSSFLVPRSLHGVTWPWQASLAPPPAWEMELPGPFRVCFPLAPTAFPAFPSPRSAHPSGAASSTALVCTAACVPSSGPLGPCSVAPPELPYLRVLDTATCLGGFGGPEDDHRAPHPCPPLPRDHSCTVAAVPALGPAGTRDSLAYRASLNHARCSLPWAAPSAVWLGHPAPILIFSESPQLIRTLL